MKEVLGIYNEGGDGIYLGLHESFVGSRVAIMNSLKEKLSERVNGWTSKHLSQAGKEVLLKSVAMVMPTFTMSCFRLPKTVCEGLASLMAGYWWRNKSWANLSKPKKEGGLGFRDFEFFNVALLGEQLWRMLQFPDSLLCRVFKGRYFKSCSPISAPLGSNPSFFLRSIHSAQALIREGSIRMVGSGCNLDFWVDPWISCSPSRALRPLEDGSVTALNVRDLLRSDGRGWDIEKVRRVVHAENVELVLSINVGSSLSRDGYRWKFNNSGLYTVKSGYWILNHVLIKPLWIPLALGVSNSLVGAGNLNQRHLATDAGCPRCGSAAETVNHVLFTGPYARLVWSASPWGRLFQNASSSSLYANFARFLAEDTSATEAEELCHIPWVLWRLWKARNGFLFSGIDDPGQVTIAKVKHDADQWIMSLEKEEEGDQTRTSLADPHNQNQIRVSFPSEEWAWCSSDGAWADNKTNAGLGWIARDSHGEFRWCGMQAIPRTCSPLFAEAKALRWVLECVARLGMKNVRFSLDCRDLLCALNNPGDWPSLAPLLDVIRRVTSTFEDVTFFYLPRRCNQVADALAGAGQNLMSYSSHLINVLPLWLQPFNRAYMQDIELSI